MFKAINDPSRRLLLDALAERDQQSLRELTALLPQMTRYGVMSHLQVLENAGLITTKRQGRMKFHYLNPMPIRLIHDRWISRFAEHRLGALSTIKRTAEKGTKEMENPTHVYRVYIKASPAEVWNAITDPRLTSQYFYGTSVQSTWEVGADIAYTYPDGSEAATGEILAIEEGRRVEMTFLPKWDSELEEEGHVREAWIVEAKGDMVELTVELYEIGPKTLVDFEAGLPYIVSGLKSLIETGTPLPSPTG